MKPRCISMGVVLKPLSLGGGKLLFSPSSHGPRGRAYLFELGSAWTNSISDPNLVNRNHLSKGRVSALKEDEQESVSNGM